MPKQKFRYSARKVECIGRRDGRGWQYAFWPFKKEMPVQPLDDQQEQASFDLELYRAAEDDLADIAISWSEEDKVLKNQYCKSLVELQMATEALTSETKDLEFAKKEFDQAEDEFEAQRQPPISHRTEWMWIAFLMVGEYFFNYIIFNMVGAEDLETHIMALVISATLPMSAMYLGMLLKKADKNILEKWMALVMLLVPVLVLMGISLLRAALFEGAWTEDEEAPPISPWAASMVFIVINLLIFLVGAVVSYMASHADPETYRTLRIRMNRARKRFDHESRDHQQASRMYQKARIAYEKAKHLRKEEFDIHQAMAFDLIKKARLYISIYHDANIGVRKNGITPPCFKEPIPELKVPELLMAASLDWSCDPNIMGLNPFSKTGFNQN
ncbi:MAG: hypothetical protein IPM48_03895 [Saprospiraceae bacterium]|nr:hypothetical protein [Saprospiraceae bacterium]